MDTPCCAVFSFAKKTDYIAHDFLIPGHFLRSVDVKFFNSETTPFIFRDIPCIFQVQIFMICFLTWSIFLTWSFPSVPRLHRSLPQPPPQSGRNDTFQGLNNTWHKRNRSEFIHLVWRLLRYKGLSHLYCLSSWNGTIFRLISISNRYQVYVLYILRVRERSTVILEQSLSHHGELFRL